MESEGGCSRGRWWDEIGGIRQEEASMCVLEAVQLRTQKNSNVLQKLDATPRKRYAP